MIFLNKKIKRINNADSFSQPSLIIFKWSNQIVKWSSRLVGESQLDPTSLYTRQLQRMATSILNDDSHPLHSEFQRLPSGRKFLIQGVKQSVCQMTKCKCTKRYKNSFVPTVLTVLNKL